MHSQLLLFSCYNVIDVLNDGRVIGTRQEKRNAYQSALSRACREMRAIDRSKEARRRGKTILITVDRVAISLRTQNCWILSRGHKGKTVNLRSGIKSEKREHIETSNPICF